MSEYMTWSELVISLLLLIGFGILMKRMGQANPEISGHSTAASRRRASSNSSREKRCAR